jgi:UDP-4-amino-4,6-dideoxy-N-acetyl-beta-L-altrosamine N-acetyltransferase
MNKIRLINFTELSLEEKKSLLEWRNNPIIRKWMCTKEEISLEEHLNFIESLKTKEDRVYFLVKQEMQDIGVVDLTDIKPKRSAELGIYANPKLKGQGPLLMECIINYAFHTLELQQLYANVFMENKRAINLYKKLNFKIVDSMKNKKMYCMELKNENR